MKKVLMIMMMSLLLGACSEDSEQPIDMLQLSGVTRSSTSIIDAGEYQSPIQIFLMSGTSKTEGNFVYNPETGKWSSTIGVKEQKNYIFGFSPSTAAAGTISPLTSGAADYSAGAVMTLDNLSAVGGEDLCVVVGVKGVTTEAAAGTPDFGTFYFEKQGTANYVSLLLDHLYSAIEFKIKIGSKYNELRDIHLKKMELQSAKTVSKAIVTLTANTAGTNPITSVSFMPTNEPQTNAVYDYGTDANTTTGLPLTAEGTKFVSYCAPIDGMGSSNLKLICTYDVYNKKGTKVRENCVAENSLAGLSGLTIARGKKSVVNLTVEPTYLYQLSEDELDNPGIKLKVNSD